MLQSAVNCGILLAMVAGLAMRDLPCRYVFLVGVLPALLVRVDSPHRARARRVARRQTARANKPPRGILDLFRGRVRRITVLTILVCSLSLTAHWAFMFWCMQHLRNLPDLADWSDSQKNGPWPARP